MCVEISSLSTKISSLSTITRSLSTKISSLSMITRSLSTKISSLSMITRSLSTKITHCSTPPLRKSRSLSRILSDIRPPHPTSALLIRHPPSLSDIRPSLAKNRDFIGIFLP